MQIIRTGGVCKKPIPTWFEAEEQTFIPFCASCQNETYYGTGILWGEEVESGLPILFSAAPGVDECAAFHAMLLVECMEVVTGARIGVCVSIAAFGQTPYFQQIVDDLRGEIGAERWDEILEMDPPFRCAG